MGRSQLTTKLSKIARKADILHRLVSGCFKDGGSDYLPRCPRVPEAQAANIDVSQAIHDRLN